MAFSSRFEISRQVRSAGYAMRSPHSHAWYELFFLLRGKCSFSISHRTWLLEAGFVALVPPEHSHRTAYLGEEANERLCIEFSEEYVQPLNEQLEKYRDARQHFFILRLSAGECTELEALIQEMQCEKERADVFTPAFMRTYFQEMMLRLLRSGHFCTPLPSTVPSAQQVMNQAADYIRQSFQNHLTLGDVAGRFHLNPSYFSKKFKACNGLGFKEYLTDVRITHSEKLLLETGKSITEIAFECGFENSNYYGDAFRHRNHVSPSEFRKQKGNIP